LSPRSVPPRRRTRPPHARRRMKHPARDDLEGNVVKAGRSLVVTRGELHAETAGKRTLVALMQQTLIVMHGKSEL